MKCCRCLQHIQQGQGVVLVELVVYAVPFRTLNRDSEGRLLYAHLSCPTYPDKETH